MRNLLSISSFAAGYGVPNYAEIWDKQSQTFHSLDHDTRGVPSIYVIGGPEKIHPAEGESFEFTLLTASGHIDEYVAVVKDGELMVCPYPVWSGDGAGVESHVQPLEEEYGKGIRFHSFQGVNGYITRRVAPNGAIETQIWQMPDGSEEITQYGWPAIPEGGVHTYTVWDTIHMDGDEFIIVTDSGSMLLETEVYTQDGRVFVLNILQDGVQIFPPQDRVWAFGGHGNYSTDFGWDNGLSCTLGEEMNYEQVCEGWEDDHHTSEIPGVEIFHSDTYGGSRNVYGFVVAPSEEQALQLLKLYEETYEVTPYEE